jgi:hypothetical protein
MSNVVLMAMIIPNRSIETQYGFMDLCMLRIIQMKRNRRCGAPVGALRSGDLGEIRPWS